MPVKLFIDFDGTITKHDVGNLFFRTFGGEKSTALITAYRNGEISAPACFRGGTEALGHLQECAIREFFRAIEMRDGMQALLSTCHQLGIEYYVVSDGLDYYIRTIFAQYEITGVPFFANAFVLTPNGSDGSQPVISFPFANAECDRCACCKRNILLRHAGHDDIIAYVGDGFSDQCPVQYADIVYARGELQTYCQEHNISYVLYDSLSDVGCHLEVLMRRKRLRKRAQAEVQRHNVFIGEA
jgi:2-hydroxy-3-keto-5-methylthiopentenyl-1-phosphate phosphatase